MIASGSVRKQGLMRCSTDAVVKKGEPTEWMCFEALYFGVGYRPAKGAQEWRNSMGGPMAGIMINLVKACAFPGPPAAPPASNGRVVA